MTEQAASPSLAESVAATSPVPLSVVQEAAPSADDTLEARAARATAELRAEAKGQPVADGEQIAATAEPLAVDPREERNKRIKALQQAELEKAQQRRQRQRAPQVDPAIEQRLQRLNALEAKVAEYERAYSDETEFLRAAEKRGIAPEKIGKWLVDSTNDPSLIAQKRIAPELEARDKKIAELEQRLESFVQTQEQHAVAAQRAHVEQTFMHHIASSQETPYSAAFLKQVGAQNFMAFADAAAEGLPPGSGLQAAVDIVESQLEKLAGIYTPAATAPKPAATPPQQSKPPRAAAKAPQTLSNNVAAERSLVEEEEDWSSIPLEERARRLVLLSKSA